MAYKVGVNLVEGTALSPIDGVTTAVAGIVGTFERGPLNIATLVTSMQQFEVLFGSVPATGTTSWYSVKAFFQKVGTGQLYVVRVASSSAAKATHNFNDRQSSPAATLKVDAANEGAWGNNLSVDVDDDAILTTGLAANVDAAATVASLVSVEGLEVGSYVEFDNGSDQEQITVTAIDYNSGIIQWSGGLTNAYTVANGSATSIEFKLSVYVKGMLVETWPNLSMNDSVSFFVERAVNSDYITCTDLKSSDTDYEDQAVATSVAAALTSGADGLTDIVGSDWSGSQANKTGVFAFDAVPDLFRLAIPNPKLTDVDPAAALLAVIQAYLDYANTRVTLECYAEVPYGTAITDAVTWGNNFSGQRLQLFFPWMKVIENGATVWLPPSTFALGTVVEKDYRRGVGKSIGNESVAYAIDLEYHVSRAEGETLNDAGINTIRRMVPGGIRIYGGRTKSPVTAFRFADAAEYWNFVARSLERATQWVVFEPNDAILWKSVVRTVTDFLANQQRQRALFDASNPGGLAYTVVMNTDNNPAAQVALGIAALDVTYVKTGTAEKFVVTLTPAPAGLVAS